MFSTMAPAFVVVVRTVHVERGVIGPVGRAEAAGDRKMRWGISEHPLFRSILPLHLKSRSLFSAPLCEAVLHSHNINYSVRLSVHEDCPASPQAAPGAQTASSDAMTPRKMTTGVRLKYQIYLAAQQCSAGGVHSRAWSMSDTSVENIKYTMQRCQLTPPLVHANMKINHRW
jgi:hypothetical protein